LFLSSTQRDTAYRKLKKEQFVIVLDSEVKFRTGEGEGGVGVLGDEKHAKRPDRTRMNKRGEQRRRDTDPRLREQERINRR
jgi:hypothetical protein